MLLIDPFMPSEIEEELTIIVGREIEEAKLPQEACTVCPPPTETSFSSLGLVGGEQIVMPRSEPIAVSPLIEVEEPSEEEEPEQEGAETSASDERTLVEEIEADGDETGMYNNIVTEAQCCSNR